MLRCAFGGKPPYEQALRFVGETGIVLPDMTDGALAEMLAGLSFRSGERLPNAADRFRPLIRMLLSYNAPGLAARSITHLCEGRHTAGAFHLWTIYVDEMLCVAVDRLARRDQRLQAFQAIRKECPVRDAPLEFSAQAAAIVTKAMTYIFGDILLVEELDPVKETLTLLAQAGLFDTALEIKVNPNRTMCVGPKLFFNNHKSDLVAVAREVQTEMRCAAHAAARKEAREHVDRLLVFLASPQDLQPNKRADYLGVAHAAITAAASEFFSVEDILREAIVRFSDSLPKMLVMLTVAERLRGPRLLGELVASVYDTFIRICEKKNGKDTEDMAEFLRMAKIAQPPSGKDWSTAFTLAALQHNSPLWLVLLAREKMLAPGQAADLREGVEPDTLMSYLELLSMGVELSANEAAHPGEDFFFEVTVSDVSCEQNARKRKSCRFKASKKPRLA